MEEIFKWFTLEEEQTYVRISWFTDNFRVDAFEGVDKMLMLFLKYCASLGIIAKQEYLRVYLSTEGTGVIKAENVRLDTVTPFNYNEPGSLQEAVRIITEATLTAYEQYITVDLTDHVFKMDMNTFMESCKTRELQRVFSREYPRLMTGESKDEIISSTQLSLSAIEEDYSKEKLDELDFLAYGSYSRESKNKQEFITDTGMPCIDGDIGGIYTRQVWTFTGPPGGGKTRFALVAFAYRCAVFHHKDVLIDELELTEAEVRNILIAHHIVQMFRGKVKIPDSIMNKGITDAQQQKYYDAAIIDLFESGKYGHIEIKDKSLAIETLWKKRLQYFRLHPNAKLWVVDYLGLLSSKPVDKYAKHLMKYEIITEGIETIKRIAKTANIGAFVINQYNDEGIKANDMGKPIKPGMMEGGHIIQRHSDYDIAMTMTPEQELARMCMFSTVKKRSAKGFKNAPSQNDLSVSVFKQITQSQ